MEVAKNQKIVVDQIPNIINPKKMKREVYFYKSWFSKFRFKDLIPCFSFSKNVQGYTFTRNYSLNCFTYCLQLSVIKYDNLDSETNIAHQKNVLKYLKK